MALIDPRRNVVVIRIVYDGPPMAGKTTSVQTLAKGLGGEVIVPKEVNGRTVYFDWLDYTGGLFEGRQIRCQIISVPGQAILASRRRHLLEGADAVVFVGDSRREHLPLARQYLASLDHALKRIPGPPIGIVMQANKRDHENAAEACEIRKLIEGSGLEVSMIESIATEGIGVREAFVFAVRLALDRVRELLQNDTLLSAAPAIDCADDLLSELSRREGGSLDHALEAELKHATIGQLPSHPIAADAIEAVLRAQVPEQAPIRPFNGSGIPSIPDENIPSGLIWPPVVGRMILHEALARTVEPLKDAQGGWSAVIGDEWVLQSHRQARFNSLDKGRAALVEWARLHVSCQLHLSSRRCIVLAKDGAAGYRLWQIVGLGGSMRSRLLSSLEQGAQSIAMALADSVAGMLHAAETWLDVPIRLPLSLRTTGASIEHPSYLGCMPDCRDVMPALARTETQILRIMSSELAFAMPVLSASRTTLLGALDELASERGHVGETKVSRLVRQLITASPQPRSTPSLGRK